MKKAILATVLMFTVFGVCNAQQNSVQEQYRRRMQEMEANEKEVKKILVEEQDKIVADKERIEKIRSLLAVRLSDSEWESFIANAEDFEWRLENSVKVREGHGFRYNRGMALATPRGVRRDIYQGKEDEIVSLRAKIDEVIKCAPEKMKLAKERIEKERLAEEAAEAARQKALEAEQERQRKAEEERKKKEEERRAFINGPKEKWAEKMKAIADVQKRMEYLAALIGEWTGRSINETMSEELKVAYAEIPSAELVKAIGAAHTNEGGVVTGQGEKFWMLAAKSITNQNDLAQLLLYDDGWARFYAESFWENEYELTYNSLLDNVTNEKLLYYIFTERTPIKYINDTRTFYQKVFSRLGKTLRGQYYQGKIIKDVFNRAKTMKGKTIVVDGFFLGMHMRDMRALQGIRFKNDKVNHIWGKYSDDDTLLVTELYFDSKACATIIGISDGIEGLEKFAREYIPGGRQNGGELKVGAEIKEETDIWSPGGTKYTPSAWWYINCPKFDMTIRMFDNGTLMLRLI